MSATSARSLKHKDRGENAGLRGRVGEILVAGLLVAVVTMLVVPLAQWVLDLLISLNFTISLLVLAMALFVRRPLTFSAFPTLLLVATLYRLALNVASTRLILTEADAGRIIGAFGGFVVGEDILVGAVIFGIIALVLFLVITKGAERVAEVAARFTLDALPGSQVSIEADLRAGTVSPFEVSRRREVLQARSHYFGSLDGAMKFVRGDAVAGLVIVLVNLAGGLAVGVLRKDMSLGEALETYGRLTVGDGLIAMIPALLVSTAAGLLVMRVGTGEDGEGAGAQLGRQLSEEPRTLLVAAALVLLLAALPGLPALPFAVLGAIVLSLGVLLMLRTGKRFSAKPSERVNEGVPGLDQVQGMLDRLAETHPVLVRETVPKVLSLPELADLVRLMEEDGLGEELLPEMLEAVAREGNGRPPFEMMERLRKRMGRAIWAEFIGPLKELDAVLLDDELEAVFDEGLATTSQGRLISVPVDVKERFLAECERAFEGVDVPILLVKPRLRKEMGRLLRDGCTKVNVIGLGELPGQVNVRISSRIRGFGSS